MSEFDIGANDLTIVDYSSPDMDLARIAQDIGHTSWVYRLADRSEDEISRVFDPGNEDSARLLYDRMSSKIGKFASAVCMFDNDPIGYCWANEDVGNIPKPIQMTKTMLGKITGKEPYVWIAQINVLPAYWNKGIGSLLLKSTLEKFKDTRKVSTYVFDENMPTLEWFGKLGFYPKPAYAIDPNKNDPNGPDYYFGEGAKHIHQWRLEHQSVGSLLRSLGNRLQNFKKD